ncbi:MAG: hypothetical protein DRO88_11440 [Promethearchaeia archaeon]|nr:MAG: hypothetical protein DRO88_11440 [Candidatus Lokiarchaeia archaeon]
MAISTLFLEGCRMLFEILIICLCIILLIIIVLGIHLVNNNERLGEWSTYPNANLYPDEHHTPYMGFPAHQIVPIKLKFCPKCGEPITNLMKMRLAQGLVTFCENCGCRINPEI